jgi:branched-chain amino acid transport system substrate-binding protein
MMRRRLTLLASVSLLGCTPAAEKIQLGAVLSTTGSNASTGAEHLDAALMAAEEINAAGGILGRELEIVHRDDTSTPAVARTSVEALADLGVPVVFGCTGSALSLEMVKGGKLKKVVMMSGSSTSPLLTTEPDDGYFFRTVPSDAGQGKLIAKRAKAAGFTKASIIYVAGAYGEGLAATFETEFKAAGGTINAKLKYTEGQSNYDILLGEGFVGTPQAVLLVAYPADGAQIIKDYNNKFVTSNPVTWYFTDSLSQNIFVTTAGKGSFSIKHEVVGLSVPDNAVYTGYRERYKARFGRDNDPGTQSTNLYDAVYLAALAMEVGGAATAEAIKANLAAVSAGGTAHGPGTAEMKASLAVVKAGGDLNFEGASGPVNFDAIGEVTAPYDVSKVSESSGEFVLVSRAVE